MSERFTLDKLFGAKEAIDIAANQPQPTRTTKIENGAVMVRWSDGTWRDHGFMFSDKALEAIMREAGDE